MREKKNLDYLQRAQTDIVLSREQWKTEGTVMIISHMMKSYIQCQPRIFYLLKSFFKNKDFQTKDRPTIKKSLRGKFFTTRSSEIQAVNTLVI